MYETVIGLCVVRGIHFRRERVAQLCAALEGVFGSVPVLAGRIDSDCRHFATALAARERGRGRIL